ncbi:MAG: hypothetical protein LBG89_01710 [Rickettsiales bacterium]|jgi:Tfp pilus assembly protein PilE|nr:hypothetical protein [Rickettsiales bacterium]
MKHELGRSLIEMVGVLAIGGIMTAAAFRAFQVIQTNQNRLIAEDQLRDVANNAKILFSGRKSFENISAGYLIKAGAMKIDRVKIGGAMTITALPSDKNSPKSFEIRIPEINNSDCLYFATKKLDFVGMLKVNGYEQTPSSYCQDAAANELSFIIK